MIIHPESRQVLRKWFEDNSATEQEVWVHCIRRKHETILSYLDVVEEALCFGWIDSTTRSLSDTSTTPMMARCMGSGSELCSPEHL